MATDLDFVEYVCEQLANVPPMTYKKMFGEYALYAGGKVVAFACDNQLYIKPTEAGKKFAAGMPELPPYPGAKLYPMVNEKLDDADWLSQLVNITHRELPEPKPKKPEASVKSNLELTETKATKSPALTTATKKTSTKKIPKDNR